MSSVFPSSWSFYPSSPLPLRALSCKLLLVSFFPGCFNVGITYSSYGIWYCTVSYYCWFFFVWLSSFYYYSICFESSSLYIFYLLKSCYCWAKGNVPDGRPNSPAESISFVLILSPFLSSNYLPLKISGD